MKKKIEVNDYTLYYDQYEYSAGEYGIFTAVETRFYKKVGITKRRKYFLFGSHVELPKYEKVFTLDLDIESPKHSKGEVYGLIFPEVCELKRLEEREMEIEKGEII